jgi:hypothetical protein
VTDGQSIGHLDGVCRAMTDEDAVDGGEAVTGGMESHFGLR